MLIKIAARRNRVLQGRISKAVIILAVIVAIWFDFYDQHLQGVNLDTLKARFDVDDSTLLVNVPSAAAPYATCFVLISESLPADQIFRSILRTEDADKKFHHSLFNHVLSFSMVCLFQFYDVLT